MVRGNVVALSVMADPKEIPQQVANLIQLTKQYLRQQTVDPMKNVGRSVGRAVAGGLSMGLGALLLALGLYRFLGDTFTEGYGGSALAAAATALVCLAAAALLARRLRTEDE